MPTRYMVLEPVSPEKLDRAVKVAVPKEHKTTFPKRSSNTTGARGAFKKWQQSEPEPAAERNPEIGFKAVRPSRRAFTQLRKIAESDAAPAVILEDEVPIETLFGTVFSGLATYEFMKQEAEYKRRKADRRPSPDIEKKWEAVVRQFSAAFEAAGLPGVGEAELGEFVRELNANKANRDAIIQIAKSGVPVKEPARITASSTITAAFVANTLVEVDPRIVVSVIGDLCDDPIAEGSFTKHFNRSISLSLKIRYPCGISWGGIEWCTKTVTLAGVSFSLAVNVGYRVNCCGATVWGQASAQVCATIVGQKVCATCTATVTGVSGISRTPVTVGCEYGLGISARLKCTLAGQTILNLSYPFGWTVTGPCPPAGLCP
jgi:hypothetical protein